MNIHLCNDEKFTNSAITRFEQYFPGDNRYFVLIEGPFRKKPLHVKEHPAMVPLPFPGLWITSRIKREIKDGDRLFIHHLNRLNAPVANRLRKKRDIESYWIFFGSDLYDLLHEKHDYPLYDSENPFSKRESSFVRCIKDLLLSAYYGTNIGTSRERFIEQLNYFCFWNPYDYQLLKKYFNTSATLKPFMYFVASINEVNESSFEKEKGTVIVNHSASRSGNHLTVLKKLKALDHSAKLSKLILPLSYGPSAVRNGVISYGREQLRYCLEPLVDFIPAEQYFEMIGKVSAAIFGNRRQAGGGNVFYLLASGAKVFLREENNLLHYLRDKEVVVFTYEKDLNDLSDLDPLSPELQKKNRQIMRSVFAEDQIDNVYRNLLS